MNAAASTAHDEPLGLWWIAENRPDLPAVASSPSGLSLTYGELAARAHQVVHALRGRGVGAGDVVAYALPNDVDIVIWQLATGEAGMHALALNPALSEQEIDAIVEHSGAKVLVAHADQAERLVHVTSRSSVRLAVSVGGNVDGFVADTDLVEGIPDTPPPDRSLGSPLTYSSGTTGKPKGVWREERSLDLSYGATVMVAFARAFRYRPYEGAHLVTAGMHHGGCQGFYLAALHVGQPLVIRKRFDAEQTLADIERFRVTTAYLVPTQFVRLLRLPEATRSGYDVSSLEVVVHSAAPCSAEVKRQMFDWVGPVIWETYGGTEGAATIATPEQWLAKPGTVGRPIRGVTITVLDDDDNPLPPGEIGNIYLTSAGPGWSYRGDPDLTASVHRGNAFTLGDVGYVDEDGFLFLCDRAKDMIISGGINIYPAEVEGVLLAHPAVGDAAVIGVPHDEWGEEVKAFVEVTGGVDPSQSLAEAIIAFSRERLASFKCPRTVEFRDQLPRTEAGKLYKRLLRDEQWAETGRKL